MRFVSASQVALSFLESASFLDARALSDLWHRTSLRTDVGAAQRLQPEPVSSLLPLGQPETVARPGPRTYSDGQRATVVLARRAMNVTVDDISGQLQWTGPWVTCPGSDSCVPPPEDQLDRIYKRSWRAGTRSATSNDQLEMSFAFNGTGIWVFGVTLPTSTLLPKVKDTLLSVTLDGVRQSDFTWQPSQDLSFRFDVLFFGLDNLGPEPHTLTVSALPGSSVIIDRLVVQQEPVPSLTASDSATPFSSSTTVPSASVIRARGLSQTTSVVLAVVIPISVALIAVLIIYFYLRARWRKEDEERRRSRMLQSLPPQKPRSAPAPANYMVHSGASDSRPSAHIASYHSGATGILAAANRAYGAMHSVWPWAPSSHEPSNIAPEEVPRRHRSRSAGSSTNFISVSRRGSRHVAAAAADAGPSNYRDSQLPAGSRRASRGPWPNNRLSALVSALPGVHETPRTSPSVATSVSRAESAGRVLVASPPVPVEVQRVKTQQRRTTDSPQPGSISAQPPESSRPASDPSSDTDTPLTLLAPPRDGLPVDEETLPSSGIMTLVNALGPPGAMVPTSPPPAASPPGSLGRRVSRPLPVPPGPHPPNERPITSGPRVGTKQ